MPVTEHILRLEALISNYEMQSLHTLEAYYSQYAGNFLINMLFKYKAKNLKHALQEYMH